MYVCAYILYVHANCMYEYSQGFISLLAQEVCVYIYVCVCVCTYVNIHRLLIGLVTVVPVGVCVSRVPTVGIIIGKNNPNTYILYHTHACTHAHVFMDVCICHVHTCVSTCVWMHAHKSMHHTCGILWRFSTTRMYACLYTLYVYMRIHLVSDCRSVLYTHTHT